MSHFRVAAMSLCILIAERNPHVAELLSRELAREGYAVRVAGDAMAVWQALGETDVTAAVVDPEIPNTSPLSVFEMLRRKRPAIPVVLHVYAEEAAQFGGQAGVVAVVPRTGDLERLKTTLAGIVGTPGRRE